MELEQIRYFVALSTDLNFGRAAAALEIGQPVLSRAIQKLERNLDIVLVDRSHKNRIALTPAGKAFAAECRRTLAQVDLAREIARRAGAGEYGTIRIGMVPTALYHGVHAGLREFRRAWPGVALSFDSNYFDGQIAALQRGALDLGFLYRNPLERRPDGISMRTLNSARHVAAVPAAWPEARRKRLRLAELAEFPFVFHRFDSAGISGALIAACQAVGFRPRIVQEVQSAAMLHSLVACEVGVAFVSANAVLPGTEGIAFVPIVDMPDFVCVEFAMAWRTDNAGKPLHALINAVEQHRGHAPSERLGGIMSEVHDGGEPRTLTVRRARR